MPIKTALWKIDQRPTELRESVLETEKLLEDMIVAEPRMLSDEWMLIGRQIATGFSGIIDLLAIAPDGDSLPEDDHDGAVTTREGLWYLHYMLHFISIFSRYDSIWKWHKNRLAT
ncbi:hypothetical protein [Acidithiobacillus ferriphilus]|uniref:hypothetical protein n=1 Tax=Acidithiobacillus ferriphilus TaxID=1689834 RepID=UPI001C06635E|nr:hypothetical protein [Acidithiobacillus ferriphilus]